MEKVVETSVNGEEGRCTVLEQQSNAAHCEETIRIKIPLVKRWPCEILNLKQVILRFQCQITEKEGEGGILDEQSSGKLRIIRSQHHVEYVHRVILHVW